MARDLVFYKAIFGENFAFKDDYKDDIVKIISVGNINTYSRPILSHGGSITVPEIILNNKQKIVYYSDPNGNIFALLQKN